MSVGAVLRIDPKAVAGSDPEVAVEFQAGVLEAQELESLAEPEITHVSEQTSVPASEC